MIKKLLNRLTTPTMRVALGAKEYKAGEFKTVITHVQYPDDQKLEPVTVNKISEGIEKGLVIPEYEMVTKLDHLFTRKTLYNYARRTDVWSAQTIENFPRPIVHGKRLFFIAQDVANYILYVEGLRKDVVMNRENGYLVIPPDREQDFVKERTGAGNFKKYRVNVAIGAKRKMFEQMKLFK